MNPLVPAHAVDHDEEQGNIALLLWDNGVCLLFVIVAAVGVNAPFGTLPSLPKDISTTTLPTVVTHLQEPTVFMPPRSTSAPPAEQRSEPIEEREPEVIPAVPPVAVAEPANVAFPVPVTDPIILVESKYASPPPSRLVTAPVRLDPNLLLGQRRGTGESAPQKNDVPAPEIVPFARGKPDGGQYPEPRYPVWALRQEIEGDVTLLVDIDETGTPIQCAVEESSQSYLLDDYVVDWVTKQWRWPPGESRRFLVPFRFVIESGRYP